MRTAPELLLAFAIGLHAPAALAQGGRPQPVTERSVTTGIGSNSTLTKTPPSTLATPGPPLPLPVDPGDAQRTEQNETMRDGNRPVTPAPSAPTAETEENPRLTITRDRIDSPQH